MLLLLFSYAHLFIALYSGQNVTMMYTFYSFMYRLEPNVVLDSLDKAVTFYAPPIREVDKNIICQVPASAKNK